MLTSSSLAYVDPGAGSMLVQLIIASCLGGIAMCRQRILAFFRRGKAEPDRDGAVSRANSESKPSDATKE